MVQMQIETPTLDSRPQGIWWVLGGGFVLLLLAIGWIYFCDDVAPPDRTLYGIESRQKGDGENPLKTFALETAILRESMRDHWKKRYQDDDQLSALSEHLEEHREVLTRFWSVLNDAPRPLSYPPDIEDYRTDCTFALQDAFSLAGRHIKLLLLTGYKNDALSKALDMAAFARELYAADITAIPWMVAAVSHLVAYDCVREALKEMVLNEQDAANLIKRLNETEATPTDVAHMLRRSCFAQSDYFRMWKDPGKVTPGWIGEVSPLEIGLFKPGESSWEVLRLMLPVAKGLEGGWKSGWRASEDLQLRATAMGHPEHIWHRIRPNLPGRWLAANMQAGDQNTVRKALQSVVICRSLQLALAVRAFELKTGSLPDLVEELVPTFLPLVLVDPITGSPLKWNRQTGLIYSVGMNGNDDGGQFDLEKSKIGDKDWGILYPWWNREQES
jgi:hypothetical protein